VGHAHKRSPLSGNELAFMAVEDALDTPRGQARTDFTQH
jgi:hypothetical protein